MKLSIIEPLQIDNEKVIKIASEILPNSIEIVTYNSIPNSQQELSDRIKDADIAVCVNTKFSKKVIENAINLKMISVSFTGYDHIDIDATNRKNIIVSNVPDYASDAVSELIFGFAISFYRKLIKCDNVVRTNWTKEGLLGYNLSKKTIGIVGFGHIGKKVAKIADAFNMNIIVHSRSKKGDVKFVELNELLLKSDIIVLALPLNKDTKGLIGKKEFLLMKKDALLINAARGPIVDTNALIDALKNNKIKGACVDVYDVEPISENDPLTKIDNLILSPHIGYYTKEALEERTRITFENIKRFIDGEVENRCE